MAIEIGLNINSQVGKAGVFDPTPAEIELVDDDGTNILFDDDETNTLTT